MTDGSLCGVVRKEVQGVNHVVHDVARKPPGTTEWE